MSVTVVKGPPAPSSNETYALHRWRMVIYKGIYMGFIWDIWDLYGIYMGFIWDLYGIYMGFIWDIWDLYGIFRIYMGI